MCCCLKLGCCDVSKFMGLFYAALILNSLFFHSDMAFIALDNSSALEFAVFFMPATNKLCNYAVLFNWSCMTIVPTDYRKCIFCLSCQTVHFSLAGVDCNLTFFSENGILSEQIRNL
jgi:hypothetical protein